MRCVGSTFGMLAMCVKRARELYGGDWALEMCDIFDKQTRTIGCEDVPTFGDKRAGNAVECLGLGVLVYGVRSRESQRTNHSKKVE
jgi:hypothetical protein